MTYDYSSESKRLELPNPYRLQNRLLWLCAALLLIAGVVSLGWARTAMQDQALRLAAAPLLTGLLMLAAGLACAATAARRLRFFFGRGRPASLAPEIPTGATGGSPAADKVKDMLRHGGITYPELPTAAAFVCADGSCSAPLSDVAALSRNLSRLSH